MTQVVRTDARRRCRLPRATSGRAAFCETNPLRSLRGLARPARAWPYAHVHVESEWSSAHSVPRSLEPLNLVEGTKKRPLQVRFVAGNPFKTRIGQQKSRSHTSPELRLCLLEGTSGQNDRDFGVRFGLAQEALHGCGILLLGRRRHDGDGFENELLRPAGPPAQPALQRLRWQERQQQVLQVHVHETCDCEENGVSKSRRKRIARPVIAEACEGADVVRQYLELLLELGARLPD
jgi:hypothetical protein